MSSGKMRVVKQPVPVSVAGGAPPPLTSATPTSQAARPLLKSPQPVVPSQPKPKSATSPPVPVKSSAPSKPAQHPPVIVASQPVVTAKPVVLDDFPPLPSKGGPSSPATPRQSTPASTDTSPAFAPASSHTQPPRNLSDAAAAMIQSNAQTRASKTQQLRDTLKKVQGREGDEDAVVVQGEETRATKGKAVVATHRRGDSAGVNPPSSPAEVHSPLDTSASFSATYSPIHRRANQTKDEHTDLDDTADLSLDDTVDGGKASNHSSATVSPSLPSKGSNRSFSNRAAAAGTFTASTQVQAGGLSEKELRAILAVAEEPAAKGDVVSKAAYLNVCRHLVRLQSVMNEREADLRMAGELGEAICAENGKLEAIVEELTHSLDAQVEEMRRLEESKGQLERRVEELSASNHQLISEKMARQVDTELEEEEGEKGGKRKKGREDSASTAVSEFIRGELATNLLNTSLDQSFDSTGSPLASVPTSPSSKPIKYTGNLILDVQNLQRKLRRERKMWDRNLQVMEQALQTKEKERAQLASDKLRLEQEMETFRELQSQLLKKNSEWEEKDEALRVREEKLAHETKMKLSTQRKSLEMEVHGKEEELRRERDEREKEAKRRADLEAQVRELNVRIDDLNHQIQLWSEEKAREQATLQDSQRQLALLTADLKAAKEEAQKKGKQIKAAEKIVGQTEQGREAEERRARDNEQKLLVEESRRAEEEKRRMTVEAELQRTQAALTQLKEQLRREKSAHEKEGLPVITADTTVTLATPHAAPKKDMATQSESKEVTTVGSAAALASPVGAMSAGPGPMWVLPQPTFTVNVKDHALLTAIFSYLAHQWTIALLLLVSNSRVKKTVEWIKDSQSTECLSCHKEFGVLFNRRHHCRLCGGLYCADCANLTVDLDKFGLEDVRVCSSCFGVVNVLTHGQSLAVQRTKVNHKVKEGKAKAKKLKEADVAPLAASTPAPAPRKAAKTPVAAQPAPTPSRPSTTSAEPSIVSGTPRVKKAKAVTPSGASTPVVKTALVVNPNGSVMPAVAPVAATPVRSGSNAPLAIAAPAVPALTYNPSPSSQQGGLVTGQVSQPVQKAVPVSAISGATVVSGGGEVVVPVKKKVVKKIVKKVKPVALAPSQ